MPEAPDLEVLREYLVPRVAGERITSTSELRPLVVRNLVGESLSEHIAERAIERLERKGKLMIMTLSDDVSMVVSPMLTGELSLSKSSARVAKSTILTMDMSGEAQLRYIDVKRMGQIYYVPSDRLDEITRISDQGPDVLDEPMSESDFRLALKRFRGEIKGVLTRGELVAGIGNAYADEVLWDAGIYPFRKVSKLSGDEISRLHGSVYRVMRDAVDELRNHFGSKHPRKERRFLNVHGKSGKSCPRCAAQISSVKSRQRDTNFCRQCQKGSMFE